jgi:two-component system, NarL family, response regulator
MARFGGADARSLNAAERQQILERYRDHSHSVEEVASGRRSADREPAEATPLRETVHRFEPTRRELEVLGLLADGLVNREIAVQLFLSEETIKSHVCHLVAKLHARSRAHAVPVGFRRGLIS